MTTFDCQSARWLHGWSPQTVYVRSNASKCADLTATGGWVDLYLSKGSVKEPNKFHNYETEKITREARDAAEYIELFGSSTRDRHARRI